jgi:hypothetical protein
VDPRDARKFVALMIVGFQWEEANQRSGDRYARLARERFQRDDGRIAFDGESGR